VGPASATDHAIARFDLTTGKLIQNSAVTIADSGATDIAAGSANNALVVTSTGTAQLSVRRTAGARLDVTVDAFGNATYAATGVFNVASHAFTGRVGIVAANQTYGLFASNDLTSSGSSSYGAGIEGKSSKTSGTGIFVYGASVAAVNQGVGATVDRLVGLDAQTNTNPLTTTTESVVIRVQEAADCVNSYGLQIGDIDGGSSLNYAIYTGTGLVRFGDAVNVDAGSKTNALNVTTTGAIQSTFRYDSSNRLDLSVSSAGIVTYDAVGASASHVFSDSVQATEYRVSGTKVVGSQGATITDPTGGTVQDSEARTAINAIIDRLQAHGLIA
jgi:hypothetical protein